MITLTGSQRLLTQRLPLTILRPNARACVSVAVDTMYPLQVLSKVIVCLVADREAELGMLKAKLDVLKAHLSGPLTPVFQPSV